MRVLVTGAGGMVGWNVCAALSDRHPGASVVAVGRDRVDLRDGSAVTRLIADEGPDVIVHAAAKVGGVGAKVASPTPFLLDNLRMDSAVVHAALEIGVPSLLYISSAAVYPVSYESPYLEEDVLTGPLESANEGYAIAKAAGARLCQYASGEYGVAFRAVLPSNLYGPHDHYDPETAHLISAALAKIHVAKQSGAREVEVWGDGTARREFTFVGDLAAWIADRVGDLEALPPLLNLGPGVDHSIADYYRYAAQVVGWDGDLRFDASRPAGIPRRLLDSSLARQHGWNPATSVLEGMQATYDDLISTVKG